MTTIRITSLGMALAAAALIPTAAFASVSEEKASALGKSLTPIGAEKAGNGGAIPAWDGGLKNLPAGFEPGGAYINPYADDERLFDINRSNVDQYKDKLSPGQVAMIKRYDDYHIPVYPTHRPANFPEKYTTATLENATKVNLVDDGNGLENYVTGTPFPIPQSGVEVVWNHITRYQGESSKRTSVQMTPQTDGSYSVVRFEDELTYRTALRDYDPNEDKDVLFFFKQEVTAPARLTGNLLLVHETLNQTKEARRAWIYNAGQKRVRRAPQVAYDGPGTAADGMRTSDNFDMFNGAPDRYDWELVGKKEMYIPYNSYGLASPEHKYEDIIKAGHINQDFTRYELHRVWHVRATLKEGERHIYAVRDMYVDEDTWQIALVDHYDGRGELWRVGEAHGIFLYDAKATRMAAEALYDLLSGRYIVLGLSNEESKPYEFDLDRSSRDYTPAALSRSGIR